MAREKTHNKTSTAVVTASPRAAGTVRNRHSPPVEVFISYAHEPRGSQFDRLLSRLCDRLKREGKRVALDRDALHNGESIRAFMERFGAGKHVVAIINERYLRSPNCMFELCSLWENSNCSPESFRKKIHPLVFEDAHCSGLERLEWARYWNRQRKVLLDAQRELGPDFGVEDQRQLKLVCRFALHVSDILSWVNDVLMPRGARDIEVDDGDAIVSALCN